MKKKANHHNTGQSDDVLNNTSLLITLLRKFLKLKLNLKRKRKTTLECSELSRFDQSNYLFDEKTYTKNFGQY